MKVITGKVISTKMAKTATVAVERFVTHPVYKKRLKKTKKYHVHDELGVSMGDVVSFMASKPFSKLKRWKIIKVIGDTKSEKGKKPPTRKASASRRKK